MKNHRVCWLSTRTQLTELYLYMILAIAEYHMQLCGSDWPVTATEPDS